MPKAQISEVGNVFIRVHSDGSNLFLEHPVMAVV